MVEVQEALNLSPVHTSSGLWKENSSGKDHRVPCKRPADDRGRIFEGDFREDLDFGKSFKAVEESKHDHFIKLSYGDLVRYTDDFSESNFIGYFQFGEFYVGKIVRSEFTQNVLVKTWHIPENYMCVHAENEMRLVDEIFFHSNKLLIDHDGIMKLYGYCLEGDKIGVVYDFNPFISVCNHILHDDFTWVHRIKVAIKFANLLAYLHGPKFRSFQHGKPLIVRNLDCAHILLDQDYNPKLCDFSMVTGGIFPDRTKYPGCRGCWGYIDLAMEDWSNKVDVYVFGTILTSLISKRVYGEHDCVDTWAIEKYVSNLNWEDDFKPMSKLSLVHESLKGDPDFKADDGVAITKIATDCLQIKERPSMQEILQSLLSVEVVKKNAVDFGVVSQ